MKEILFSSFGPSGLYCVAFASSFTLYLILTIPRLHVLVSFGVGDTMFLFRLVHLGLHFHMGKCPPWIGDVLKLGWFVSLVHF